jgi:hypothetical protein
MDDRKTSRDRMAAQPFAPIDSDIDSRNAHALSYIAYYLGTIEQHLAAIAGSLARPQPDQTARATALKDVVAALRPGTPKAAIAAAPPMELFHPSEPKDLPRGSSRPARTGARRMPPPHLPVGSAIRPPEPVG